MVPFEKIVWTPEMTETLRRMRADRKPIEECAERIGVSYETARQQIISLGLPIDAHNGGGTHDAILIDRVRQLWNSPEKPSARVIADRLRLANKNVVIGIAARNPGFIRRGSPIKAKGAEQ